MAGDPKGNSERMQDALTTSLTNKAKKCRNSMVVDAKPLKTAAEKSRRRLSKGLAKAPEEWAGQYQEFIGQYPAYPKTKAVDKIRAKEFPLLNRDQVYLDYTGAGLYATSQIAEHQDLLKNNLCGNPHSISPSSALSTHMVENTRKHILQFFNADPNEYRCIFTANATGAIKLVGESYPFAKGGRYLLTTDNHNSVHGIREYAVARGAKVSYVPLAGPNTRLDMSVLTQELGKGKGSKLFAFPAQSNFTGVKHSLEIVALAQSKGWDVLLDAAAFVPTNPLDLRAVKPEFVSLSFYKMFGYPTGLGALLIKKSNLSVFIKPWFAGGTVTWVSLTHGGPGYLLEDDVSAWEDGTVNFLMIPAISIGLRFIERVGYSDIRIRVNALTGWLLDSLLALKHDNGFALVYLIGPADCTDRGGTITFIFQDQNKKEWLSSKINDEAVKKGFSIRNGCFCNPGPVELLKSKPDKSKSSSCHSKNDTKTTKAICVYGFDGAVRISVSHVTNFVDVYKWIQFSKSFLNRAVE